MKEVYGFKLEDFSMVKEIADDLGMVLAIDNNRDGVRRLAKYNKSFLSRKLNASGSAIVFLMKPGFLTWDEKVVSEYHFEE